MVVTAAVRVRWPYIGIYYTHTYTFCTRLFCIIYIHTHVYIYLGILPTVTIFPRRIAPPSREEFPHLIHVLFFRRRLSFAHISARTRIKCKFPHFFPGHRTVEVRVRTCTPEKPSPSSFSTISSRTRVYLIRLAGWLFFFLWVEGYRLATRTSRVSVACAVVEYFGFPECFYSWIAWIPRNYLKTFVFL